QVRDALAWADQINESIERFGARLEVEFASHHWPICGRERVIAYLKKQRDLYQYIHDQTLRLANMGYVKEEIAEQLRLPASLASEFYNRDYYGTVHHNARAVYVKYLGFFDGNPAHLYPLPPGELATRYLEFMGGADQVVARARESFAHGDYRWVAEVLNHVVMADPEHVEGRALLADTLEQLGYQSESGPWRNFFLCGALELRHGLPEGSNFVASESMARSIPIENLFMTLAVRLNGSRADGIVLNINLDLKDEGHVWLNIENAVLHAFMGKQHEAPAATMKLSSLDFKRMMMGLTSAADLMAQGTLEIDGDAGALITLTELFDQFERRFPIVTPRAPFK
ncbi:MAG: alkyl sulfatase dimerization domain-containing protein, partial [Pseudomonadales bacterium]